ncbi:MAG: inositol monophosphatase family protein [Geminicoccaceae bacterium]
MAIRSANLTVMINAAEKAARQLVRDFGEVENLQVSRKGPGDFVSIADRRTEEVLVQELSRARPGHGFLREEGDDIAGDGRGRWIIDPLDGTTNFLHGLPHFCISIALEEHGELVSALIYDPIKGERFVAERGGGAFLNERRIRVSGRTNLEDSVIACGIPVLNWPGQDDYYRQAQAVGARVAGLRRFGAAALDLAYVAAGRYEAFWEYRLKPWDVAAGILIVREAGGTVTELHGGDPLMDQQTLVAANAYLHSPLSKLLKETA